MAKQYVPNTWPVLGKTYYVAQKHPEASDENPGTEAQPFLTISAAARVAKAYDRIVIDEGVYREQVALARHGHIYYPRSWISFEAVPGKEVYVKGSDVFEADWQDLGGGVYAADLPRALFKEGAYNPYALACSPPPDPHSHIRGAYRSKSFGGETEGQRKVRPARTPGLPETLGQIYVDGEALDQLGNLEAVRETPNSFVVSGDGRQIICHFSDGEIPDGKLVELTVRERCFKPMFPVPPMGLMIKTMGIRAEHAADPGAFSFCRPLSIRRNSKSGINVRKTLHVPNSTSEICGVLRGNPSYLSKDDPAILCHVRDGTRPVPPQQAPIIALVSRDGAKTWQPLETGPLADCPAGYFLDGENGMLLRQYARDVPGDNPEATGEAVKREQMLQISPDAGKTWSEPQKLDFGKDVLCFTMLKLRSGRLFLITTENRPELSPLFAFHHDQFFFVVKTWLGNWREDLSGVDWEPAATLRVNPEMGLQGVDEPQACQLPDGRIFAVFRQCGSLPSQTSPGFPTVKLYAVSEDDGRTWSDLRPLTFEDGTYVYSSVSFASAFCSSRNGRAYVILNILNRPFEGCLPRVALHIAEIDKDTFSVKRDTITVIEEVHEEHSFLVGYSNWGMLEDRYTKNLLLFMKLENGPVYDGYDWSSYRYEIEFPG